MISYYRGIIANNKTFAAVVTVVLTTAESLTKVIAIHRFHVLAYSSKQNKNIFLRNRIRTVVPPESRYVVHGLQSRVPKGDRNRIYRHLTLN